MSIDNLVDEAILEKTLNEKPEKAGSSVINLVVGFLNNLYTNGAKSGQDFDVDFLKRYISANRQELDEISISSYLTHVLQYLKKTVKWFRMVDEKYVSMPYQAELIISRQEMNFEEMQKVIIKNAKKDSTLGYTARDMKVYNVIKPIVDYVYLVTEMGWQAGRGHEILLKSVADYCEKRLGEYRELQNHLKKFQNSGISITSEVGGNKTKFLLIDPGYKLKLPKAYKKFEADFSYQQKKGITKTRTM